MNILDGKIKPFFSTLMIFFVLFAKISADMSYFNTQKEFSLRDLLYRALIFIGTVGIIVYFLPRDGKFNYQFDIDKPWKYGQLMATFDFPIYKGRRSGETRAGQYPRRLPAVFPAGQKH